MIALSTFRGVRVLSISGVVLLLASHAMADVIHVPQDFPTIQDAMNAASAGDTVLVADGVYSGPGNTCLFYAGSPITLVSANGPENCIIDCEGTTCAFFLVADEPANFIIDGFTITNGAGGLGGAFFIHHQCQATIANCHITGNTSDHGGAVLCENNSSPTFINCVISGNTASRGGAFHIWDDSSPVLINCAIFDNLATLDGGGLYFNTFGTSPSIINCTIADNDANRSGGAVFVANGSPTIDNSILWRNGGSPIADATGNLSIRYSDVEGGFAGPGNINSDPRFVDPESGDYQLLPASPCIDAGDNDAVLQGIKTDLNGRLRFVDDPFIKDTGNGVAPIVDMGPFERQNVRRMIGGGN